ncbi:hypothetical protein A2380_00660 [candidate division WWE3 bacterium RIFOXYB1_FULL_43_24]|uniref:Uncharacterized protein n=1 Tax=candidate division WWE3 bacterium GW2011_GWF1_42_14 TaxID=1619138 RepID=A0A0G1BP28_UNCKA|nr:MAG: hypothetical protein UU92_C0005G0060 [candidate division WWE3 bacterium GW2011_GWA1_42_12]KKS33949.1 MAG: hypothetical protein UU97_C0017G0001 [candidate division WWE3 bacterium GW2011_GWD1_42_14]KKS39228.1 MAG: hypothetical protein UV00_C0003G0060 [candidate division WWE3 bacterium GW2011_GWF1_42_14]KKS40726.1 MAG: hypothetical protein UV03_C0003G0039 [candidate division WWE3 bacterium GW2011_GWE1_42_16]OGC59453.1 MAG: hypothetical protein A2212_01050 [candidate division WWE3 bacterium
MRNRNEKEISLFLEGFYDGIPHHQVGDNEREFAIIADLINDGKSFEKVLNDLGDDVESAMRHDDPDVMSRAVLWNEVKKQKLLIMGIANSFDRRVLQGKKHLHSNTDAKKLFDTLIKYK